MSPSPALAGAVNGSTLRSRRRRARLRASGLKTAIYPLDACVADGIDRAAERLGVAPAVYLTRLVLPDLVQLGLIGPMTVTTKETP